MPYDYTVSQEAVEKLKRYDYPGNVRELRNILFIAATQSKGKTIDADTIVEVMRIHSQSRMHHNPCQDEATTTAVAAPTERPASLDEVESQHVAGLLAQHHGNRRLVAAALGISERTLYRKLKKYGLG